MARVLVTGGAGMIGSHLVTKLCDQEHSVLVVDDLSRGKRKWVDARAELFVHDLQLPLPADVRFRYFDKIYHLAARVGNTDWLENHQFNAVANGSIDRTVFQLAVEKGSSLFYASTSCVYPSHRIRDSVDWILTFPEEFSEIGSPFTLYGWYKLTGEKVIHRLRSEYGLKVSIARIFNAYGPRGQFGTSDAHFIPSIIHQVLLGNKVIKIWGTGLAERSFVFVEDVVSGILAISDSVVDGTPVNLGSPKSWSVQDVVRHIQQAMGTQLPVQLDSSKPEGPLLLSPDLKRISDLGWGPGWSLHAGVTATVEWIKDQMEEEKQ